MKTSEITRREFLMGAAVTAIGASSLLQACSHTGQQRVDSRKRLSMSDIPTVELHRHFEAGMSPETIATLAQKNQVTHVLTRNGKQPIEGVDPQNPDSIRAYYQKILSCFKGTGGFDKFLDSFGLPAGVMCSLEDLQYAASAQILDQAQRGSIHTELRGSPYTYQDNLKKPAPFEAIMEAIRIGIKQAYESSGASGAYIACISRNKVERYGADTVKAVLATHTSDFPIGFDIAGGMEGKFPPAMFAKFGIMELFVWLKRVVFV